MRTTIVVGLTILISSAVLAANNLQPMNVKLGLWEENSTVTVTGQPPIPADQLAQMTPEQRAKAEAALKALTGTRTISYKSCVTKEKLAQGTAFQKPNCTWSTVASTSSKLEMQGVCTENGGVKMNVNLHIVAVNQENVTGSGQMTMSGNGRSMNSNAVFNAKWVGSDCGSVK